MLRIIDATLASMDRYTFTKEQLYSFCDLMKSISITDLEISKKVYHTFGKLPEGFRFYLYIDIMDDYNEYKDIYKLIYHNQDGNDAVMGQIQVNDVREVEQLHRFKNQKYIRIVGLDDLICRNYEKVFKEINKILNHSILNFCPENDYGCATALAVQWVLGGGKEITVSFGGWNNKAATEEVLMALRIALRHKVNQDLSGLTELKKLMETVLKQKFSCYKPVIGSEIFCVESGIHVDGILKNPFHYQPYLPETVGQETKIIIGKHSGRASVKQKLMENNIRLNESAINDLLVKIKYISGRNRRSLKNEEFLKLVNEVSPDARKKENC